MTTTVLSFIIAALVVALYILFVLYRISRTEARLYKKLWQSNEEYMSRWMDGLVDKILSEDPAEPNSGDGSPRPLR